MADLPASGGAGGLGLAHGVAGEVVVVHIPLGLLRPDGVQLLGGGHHVQGADGEHLGLTAGKETGAVDPRQESHLRGQGTNLVLLAAIHPVSLQQPRLDYLLLELIGELLQVLVHIGIVLQIQLVPVVDELVPAGLPDVLVVGVQSGFRLVHGGLDNLVKQLLIEISVGIVKLLLADFRRHLVDEGHLLLVLVVGQLNGLKHQIVGDFVGPGLDHDHLFAGRHHSHIQVGFFGLLSGGVDHQLSVHIADLQRAHRTAPGDVGDCQGGGGADEGGNFRGAVVVHAHDGTHNRHVVAEVAGEQGTDWPVNDAAGENTLLAGTPLPAEEAAGDTAHGVHLLLKVHAEGEEVDAVPRAGGGGGRDQDSGLAVCDHHGGVGQLGDLAGLQGQGPSGQVHGIFAVVGELFFSNNSRHSKLLFES